MAGVRINRDQIVEQALELLAAYGLADVTMRRVAAGLHVAPGALYWHIKNKQELIAAMARQILAPVLEHSTSGRHPGAPGKGTSSPRTGTDAAELLATFRRCVLAIRDGAEVVSAAISAPALREEVLARLCAALAGTPGTSAQLRLVATALLNFAIGAVITEQGASQLRLAAGTEARSATTGAPADAPRSDSSDSSDSAALSRGFSGGVELILHGARNLHQAAQAPTELP
ncbi:TetR family transcriptional regulator [Corynebacterium atypicum]|uniref:TetR family transcriptional regulator n=1 Tax=Corynebacterium atypicum TaxID=191610 RepID=UPI00068EA125|nr:TetR family transcriptional regulator [Corynebacterium atypicum]